MRGDHPLHPPGAPQILRIKPVSEDMMEKNLGRKETQKKEQQSESRAKRFNPPRPNVDEDPGKDIWYMGF